jgi:hypothetical protein
VSVCVSACVCVCVCVRERERERERVCVCVLVPSTHVRVFVPNITLLFPAGHTVDYIAYSQKISSSSRRNRPRLRSCSVCHSRPTPNLAHTRCLCGRNRGRHVPWPLLPALPPLSRRPTRCSGNCYLFRSRARWTARMGSFLTSVGEEEEEEVQEEEE